METIGNITDKLIIANIRIWFAEDIKRNPNATDAEIAQATRITNITNGLRTDLIQELDEAMNQIAKGKQQKLYKQGMTKMYGKKL